jgi:hypothetical protein
MFPLHAGLFYSGLEWLGLPHVLVSPDMRYFSTQKFSSGRFFLICRNVLGFLLLFLNCIF